jgi:hypothetical protein
MLPRVLTGSFTTGKKVYGGQRKSIRMIGKIHWDDFGKSSQ